MGRPLGTFTQPERITVKAAQGLVIIKTLTINSFPETKTKETWVDECYAAAYRTTIGMYFFNRFPDYHLIDYQLHQDLAPPHHCHLVAINQ